MIAYSTCSQLGYMFAAAGVSAYDAAMFHLFTHAFFKALLFLGAGAVIHAMHHEQDMRKMGGLCEGDPLHLGDDADRQSGADRRRHSLSWTSAWPASIPRTRSSTPTFAAHTGIGTYAFITDWSSPRGMTIFYSWRQFLMTFHGRYRGLDTVSICPMPMRHAHDEPVGTTTTTITRPRCPRSTNRR